MQSRWPHRLLGMTCATQQETRAVLGCARGFIIILHKMHRRKNLDGLAALSGIISDFFFFFLASI